MNAKIKLVSLGATVAIALLPTPARADAPTPLADTDDIPTAPTSLEPLPDGVLEGVPEGGVAEEVVPVASQPAPGITAVKPTNATINARPDHSASVQAEALRRPPSTDSGDLQPVESIPMVADVMQPPLVQPTDIAQTATTPSQSDQWHFLLVPYVYLPLSISGSVDYEGTDISIPDGSRDFEINSDRISTSLENDLNFALLSGFEAWTPDYHLGILANFNYLSLTSDETLTRSARFPGAANFVPTELKASLDTELWNASLAAGYRFYDSARVNAQEVDTEFDLGPFVADVLAGLNVTSLETDLDLSTNLGGEVEFSRSNTLVSPLLGGRVRWNANPQLAVVVSGTVSGFGISGLTRYGVQGGVSWLFSGNTSVGLGYRFASLEYNADEVEINADQNGPYLNFGFRF
ncbi:hypothetical protein [Halomicronema sp. CCY15110]|uniref:hypothetical protein n=1 Tax=Halomicronema sp. CCY15110 TaxID=2767773 RepID=UPI0019527EC2|nr:hypothetical protein [Halomicronema sp. CCY15110]